MTIVTAVELRNFGTVRERGGVLCKSTGMVPEGEQRASLSDWGVYIAGVASVLIWILKMLADKSKGVQKSLLRDRDGAMPQSCAQL